MSLPESELLRREDVSGCEFLFQLSLLPCNMMTSANFQFLGECQKCLSSKTSFGILVNSFIVSPGCFFRIMFPTSTIPGAFFTFVLLMWSLISSSFYLFDPPFDVDQERSIIFIFRFHFHRELTFQFFWHDLIYSLIWLLSTLIWVKEVFDFWALLGWLTQTPIFSLKFVILM